MKNVSLDNGAKNPHDRKSLTNPIVDKDKIFSVILKIEKKITKSNTYHQVNDS